jgi:hypothetical protein
VLYLLLGVVQIFLAGLGVWNLDQKVGSDGETALDPHRITGMIMGLVGLLILVAALVARPNGQAIGLSFARAQIRDLRASTTRRVATAEPAQRPGPTYS